MMENCMKEKYKADSNTYLISSSDTTGLGKDCVFVRDYSHTMEVIPDKNIFFSFFLVSGPCIALL